MTSDIKKNVICTAAYNPYIKLAREEVKGIPSLKIEVLKLKNEFELTHSEKVGFKLKVKLCRLNFVTSMLAELGNLGFILQDKYFNGLEIKELCKKYEYNVRTINRIINFHGCYVSLLEELSVLLYGVDALRFEKDEDNCIHTKIGGQI